ncbi:hypothetical protein EZS27_014786 [termite gut metagenome]|uniref:HNH nuclease domain-containing protein n=1 Tax=termite gut metagenome TaxID=433724 RepID=A0A5J4RTL9_9ZZZZ
MKNLWTKEELHLLHIYYQSGDVSELAVQLGRTISAVKTRATRCGLKRSKELLVWNPDRVKILKQLYNKKTNAQIAEILGVSEGAASAAAFKQGLRKTEEFKREHSSKGFFPKGHVPANKGKKQTEYMSEESIEKTKPTRFGKGHIPHNHKPVGYERTNRDGYIEIKVAEPNVFEYKHKLLWRQHNGKIPPGQNIKFKDGNKLNIRIENLYMVSKAENIRENTMQRYPDDVKKAIKESK